LLIAIGDAIEAARIGTPNDESIALQANKLVRRYLDKQAITYADYKIWRTKNPLIFTSIVDRDNSLIGFFDVLPLSRKAGDGIIAGTLSERSLTIDHLVPLSETPNATHVHIATILTNPRQRVFPPLVARETLLFKLKQFIEQHYAPVGSRAYTGYAQTKFGKALLQRSGFVLAVFGKNNEQRFTPLRSTSHRYGKRIPEVRSRGRIFGYDPNSGDANEGREYEDRDDRTQDAKLDPHCS
jgi:hypothetical protein